MGKLSPGCLIGCGLTHPGPLVKVTHLQECLSLPKELFTQGQYLSLAPCVAPWQPTQCFLTTKTLINAIRYHIRDLC